MSTTIRGVRLRWLVLGALTGVFSVSAAHAQQPVKTDLPDSLVRQAKIPESAARTTALARVHHGQVQAVELEREHGYLQYSYDIKVPGRAGITEVNVDARSGKVIGISHEGPRTEAKEAKTDTTS